MEDLPKELERETKDGIVYKAQVAHVTFYIKKHRWAPRGWYEVYSESEKDGRHDINILVFSYECALSSLEDEIRTLEEILERKRSDIPTPKQLHFLFRNKIPIPLTLTWGGASDIVDQRLAQIQIEKQTRQQDKETRKNRGETFS